MSGDLGRRRHGLAAAAGDLELRAGNVELGSAAWVVDAELLDAEEVVTRGDAGGEGDGVSFCGGVRQG